MSSQATQIQANSNTEDSAAVCSLQPTHKLTHVTEPVQWGHEVLPPGVRRAVNPGPTPVSFRIFYTLFDLSESLFLIP